MSRLRGWWPRKFGAFVSYEKREGQRYSIEGIIFNVFVEALDSYPDFFSQVPVHAPSSLYSPHILV